MNQWDSPFPVIVPLPVGGSLSEAHLYYGESPLEVAKRLKAKSVHMIVCSPPPWGLRPYDTESQVWDGKTDCEHDWFRNKCTKCNAWKGGIGLEPTIDLYVQHLVEIFRGLRRVLRDDGTLWVHLEDLYLSKGLCGTPWRVALALQADGWVLRNDIIWSKPNPVPESMSDRFTRSHEYVFMLSKSERCFFDQNAVRDSVTGPDRGSTVWNISTQCESHFATWPEDLVEIMIKAGTSEKGCCAECGAPLRRKIELGASKWEPSCKCYKEGDGCRCVVLDPFSGSGTTGRVALMNGRDYIGIDLRAGFLGMACSRIRGEAPPDPVPEPEARADSVLDIFG